MPLNASTSTQANAPAATCCVERAARREFYAHMASQQVRRCLAAAGEALQIKLEQLPEVARAYVHLDYETTHAPEHS